MDNEDCQAPKVIYMAVPAPPKEEPKRRWAWFKDAIVAPIISSIILGMIIAVVIGSYKSYNIEEEANEKIERAADKIYYKAQIDIKEILYNIERKHDSDIESMKEIFARVVALEKKYSEERDELLTLLKEYDKKIQLCSNKMNIKYGSIPGDTKPQRPWEQSANVEQKQNNVYKAEALDKANKWAANKSWGNVKK